MKTATQFFGFSLLLIPLFTYGQGVFVYDQLSSSDETVYPIAGIVIQNNAPVGQSFTPSISSIGFVRFMLYDYSVNNGVFTPNGLGATLMVNLRATSITGTTLSSTDPVYLPDGFAGPTTFSFHTPPTVAPGTQYFFEVVVVSGDLWKIAAGEYNYSGGHGYFQGSPFSGDQWFQEGIIVPEPSSVWLVLMGGGILLYAGKCKRKNI
jgi:hypothetical protein